MSIPFHPPSVAELDALYNRPNDAERLGATIKNISDDYMARRQQKQKMELEQQDRNTKQQALGLAGRKTGLDYALKFYDPHNPSAAWDAYKLASGQPMTQEDQAAFSNLDLRKAGGQKGTQFTGFLNGKPLVYNPNTSDFSYGQLPDGGTGEGFQPKVQPAVPAPEVDKVSGLGDILRRVGEVEKNYDPGFVGPLNSRVQSVQQTTGFGANPKAAVFKRALSDVKDSLLRARSGAQINETEFKRLSQLVPSEDRSAVDFNARLQSFKTDLQQTIANKQSSFQKAGYRNVNFSPAAPYQPQQSGPQPGSIEDGHQFLGGDPADPNSWKEIQ